MQVTIMRGIPGSGKSTWVKNRRTSTYVCSADNFFMRPDGRYAFDPAKLPEAHDRCLRAFLNGLRDGYADIVVDNTNIRAYEIAPYYRLAEIYMAMPRIVWCIAPLEVCLARNVHGVPEATIRGMLNGVEALPPWWNVTVVPTA